MIIKHWTLIIPQVTPGLLSIVDNVGILKSYLTSLSPILQSSALFGLKTLDKPTCIILHPGQGSSWALINHQKVRSQVSKSEFYSNFSFHPPPTNRKLFKSKYD